MEYVLKTNHLTKSICGKDIVSDIELHVKKGGRLTVFSVPMEQEKLPL